MPLFETAAAISGAKALVKRIPWKWVGLALLFAVIAVLWLRLDAANASADRWEAKAEAEEAKREAQLEEFRAAAALTEANHQRALRETETKLNRETERINREHQADLATAGALVERVRRENRRLAAAANATRSPDDPPTGPGPDDSGVRLDLRTAERSARNEIRLINLQEYVTSLLSILAEHGQTEGDALPDP